MLAEIMGVARTPPESILPEAALMRLQEHHRHYASWLQGPDALSPGDTVTLRRDAPVGGHGMLFLVLETDRRNPDCPEEQALSQGRSCPPPRSRQTGLREDVRVAFISRDEDRTLRSMWIEGWMLETWSLEQARHHAALEAASPTGPAQ